MASLQHGQTLCVMTYSVGSSGNFHCMMMLLRASALAARELRVRVVGTLATASESLASCNSRGAVLRCFLRSSTIPSSINWIHVLSSLEIGVGSLVMLKSLQSATSNQAYCFLRPSTIHGLTLPDSPELSKVMNSTLLLWACPKDMYSPALAPCTAVLAIALGVELAEG